MRAQTKVKELTAAKERAEENLNSLQKQYKAQELVYYNEVDRCWRVLDHFICGVQNTSLLQKNVKSLGEELKEAKVTALEAQNQQAHWKTIK